MVDALVMGSGPAGLSIAAALCREGLDVMGLSPTLPSEKWTNTYGIWRDELEPFGLTGLLSHHWSDCVVYAHQDEIPLHRSYGLLDKDKLQAYFLEQCEKGQISWHQGIGASLKHTPHGSVVTTQTGADIAARVVIDASGHQPAFIQRPSSPIAYQAAYGIVGRFSSPPVRPQQFVLMDYRSDHLSAAERTKPATFLYAMDLGNDVYFVEETSLANRPAVSFEVLEQRLYRRLSFRGVEVKEVHHIERCLFPMNLPLPFLDQPVFGFGGAASMVHPASGYLVGSLLRHAPAVAASIARALDHETASPIHIAQSAWHTLWTPERIRKHDLYLFGLDNLMQFEEENLHRFFATFFRLPLPQWSGFLADALSMPELLQAMLGLFSQTTNGVRKELIRSAWHERKLLWHALMT